MGLEYFVKWCVFVWVRRAHYQVNFQRFWACLFPDQIEYINFTIFVIIFIYLFAIHYFLWSVVRKRYCSVSHENICGEKYPGGNYPEVESIRMEMFGVGTVWGSNCPIFLEYIVKMNYIEHKSFLLNEGYMTWKLPDRDDDRCPSFFLYSALYFLLRYLTRI